MHIATLSSKYQICIPKEIREQLNLKVGQQLIFISKGNTLHLVPRLSIQDIRGVMKGIKATNIRDRSDRV